MATTLSHSESRRLYSWWWDSHISPKNSKWLKENLTDMDSNVKAMIKLIEEDADSFARRAEMYYKKRPDLIKLVEEFYRAYRALAERYDHATVELHQAHRTMVEALPNTESLLDPDVLPTISNSEWSHRGLKQLGDIFASETMKGGEVGIHASAEVLVLEKILAEIQAEKEAVVRQYKLSLQRLSSLEKELEDAGGLDERASRAEIEIKVLKETLAKLEAERDVSFLQYNNLISRTLDETKGLDERAYKAEAKNLKSELSGLEAEKEVVLARYNRCLEMVSILQGKISTAEGNARSLYDQTEKAEAEVKALKQAISRLSEEKEGAELQYEIFSRRIAELELEIARAREDVKRLNNEVETGDAKLKCVEEERDLVAKTNQSLQLAAGDLAQKIANKDQEVLQKGKELEALQTLLQDEQFRFVEAEATLKSFQKLHSQSQEEQKNLALKLDNKLQMLKDLETRNHDLQGDLQRVKEENQSLVELNSSSSVEVENLQNEICRLEEFKGKLEEDLALQLAQSNSLHQDILHLKEEIEGLRSKSKGLEEFCQMLKDERSALLQERSNLLAQLQNGEIRMGNLETGFAKLEGKCNDLERDKDSTLIQVKEFQVFLGIEKQERSSYAQSSESRMVDLEKQVHVLREERTSSKKEFEEELDKAVNAQVEIFVLQKFIEDLKQMNLSLLFECQKSNKLMAEFETENLEQQVEIEFLLDEVEKLRKGINQLFCALQVNPVTKHNGRLDEEQIPFGHMLDGVKNLKCSFLKNEDEKQQLAVENLVLCTFLNELSTELGSVGKSLEQDMTQQVDALEKDKFELLAKNEKLRVDANKQEEVLRAHLESQHLNLVSLEDSYQALREENFQLVQQNSSILQKLEDLEAKNGKLEEDYNSTLEEAPTLRNILTVFGNFRSEKAEEVESLNEHLTRVDIKNGDLKKKIEILEEKLGTKEAESSKLIEEVEILHKKLNEGEDLNDQLYCQTVIGKELLTQQALELSQAEQRLRVAENSNAEVCSTIEELKRKIEEHRIKEDNLTLELHERVNEFQLWESEASSFYFDQQASSIRDVILDNKVHELTSACEHLEEMNVTKDMEIERMKERFGSLESEIDGLKAQLSAYGPAIASLQKNVESLEHNALHANSSKIGSSRSSGEDMALQTLELIHQELEESKRGAATDGISELLKMQARIGAVEKAMVEQASRLRTEEVTVPEAQATTPQRPIRSKVKLDAPLGEAELWELKEWLSRGDNSFRKDSEIAILMKDIPLDQMSDRSSRRRSKRNSTGSESAEDQMLELYETVEPGFKRDSLSRSTRRKAVALSKSRSRRNVSQKKRDPPVGSQLEKEVGVDRLEERFQDGNRRKILERIESDAQKLMSVQLTVQELKSKMEMKKKSKKADNDESERVKKELLQVDEAILQLFSLTNQLARDIQETPSSAGERSSVESEEADITIKKRVTERARRWSEKIGRLQFEVESIRYNVLQLEDDKKKSKGKHRFPGSRTRIILRDFVYSGRRNSIRRRNDNACFCGCGRPLTLEN